METQPPTVGRILIAAGFAISCFALALFLWLTFGGAIPLKPEGYRFTVPVNEATQLAIEADVRVAGVPVGKVRAKRLDPAGDRTIATIELERRYAPIRENARATLRQKTLLGETYVELTTGTQASRTLPEGTRLPNRQVKDSVELDEILNALDPFTRQAFRTWQQSLAVAVKGRGQDLNDTLGNLPEFVVEGGDLLQLLDEQRQSLGLLVRNTGVVFGALTEREGQLRNLVVNTDDVFTAIASEREAFAEIWRVFPTFLDESRLTYDRLRRFSITTRPLFRDLTPAIEDLSPTLRAVGDFAPDLRRFFINLDPLLTSSLRTLPQLREVFDGLRPLLTELGPWLQQINPILEWIGHHQATLSDIFANLGVATAAKTLPGNPESPGHYLRQFGATGTETAAIHTRRLSSNRGNAYFNPLGVAGPDGARSFILPSFDCNNSGGDKAADSTPACRTQQPYIFKDSRLRFPHINASSYAEP